jgi:uncharacterized membrane-anchored protein
MMRWKLAAGWVALQILFFGAWAAREERRFDPGVGQSILVKTEPVDPRDLLRGQYLQLSYTFNRMGLGGFSGERGTEFWCVLRQEGEFHVPVAFSWERPRPAPGEVALRGRNEGRRLVYGIEEYFVPEGTETPEARDVTVSLRVGNNGRARIEKVYVKGVPWP